MTYIHGGEHKIRSIAKLILMTFLIGGIGCAAVTQSPTGRTQLMLFSDNQINAAAAKEFEVVKSKEKIITSGPRYDAVQRVAQFVASASGHSEYNWEFILIDSSAVVNAWCMPGGKVAVYTGVLPVARDEAGLATVLAHEIGHAVARHSNERASQSALLSVVGAGVDMGTSGSKNHDVWMSVFGAGATVGIMLPYSRVDESEADEIGINMMAKAGFDPHAAPELWDRMAAMGGSRVPQFLSTHPNPQARAVRLRELLPAAMQVYNAAPIKHEARILP